MIKIGDIVTIRKDIAIEAKKSHFDQISTVPEMIALGGLVFEVINIRSFEENKYNIFLNGKAEGWTWKMWHFEEYSMKGDSPKNKSHNRRVKNRTIKF